MTGNGDDGGYTLADSGGANQIVDAIVNKVGPRTLPWAMALVAAIIGLPMFFEIGVVPTLIIAGPLLAQLMDRLVPGAEAPDIIGAQAGGGGSATGNGTDDEEPSRRPKFIAAIACMLLPVALMLVKGIGDLVTSKHSRTHDLVDFIGNPAVALLAAILLAMRALGVGSGMKRGRIHASLGSGLPPVASIMLIVAAGGAGFWLVEEYFGLTVWETIKSWSVMETTVSVVAFVCALIIGWIV